MQHLTTYGIAALARVDVSMVRRRLRRGETEDEILDYYAAKWGWHHTPRKSSMTEALVSLGRWYNNYSMAFPLVGELLASAFMVDSDTDQWYNDNSRTNVGAELGGPVVPGS